MKTILLIFFCLVNFICFGQIDTAFTKNGFKIDSIYIGKEANGFWKYSAYSNGWTKSEWVNDSGKVIPYMIVSRNKDTIIEFSSDGKKSESIIVGYKCVKNKKAIRDTIIFATKHMRYYYPNGKLFREGNLRDYNYVSTLWGNIWIGTWVEYYESGEIKLIAKFKDGAMRNSLFGSMNMTPKRIRSSIGKGKWKRYYENGKINVKYSYCHSIVIKEKIYDENGKVSKRYFFPSSDKLIMDENNTRTKPVHF